MLFIFNVTGGAHTPVVIDMVKSLLHALLGM
jgi:hypothetical protein